MKVLELRFLHRDARMFFKGKWRDRLIPGANWREGEIQGLQMTLNPHTSIVSIDAPGDSTAMHLSAVNVRLEPSIEAHDPLPVAVPVPAPPPAPTPAAKRVATAAELGFDPNGDDLDDDEVAKLLQSKSAKAAVKKRGRPKKVAPAPVEHEMAWEADDTDDADEGDDA